MKLFGSNSLFSNLIDGIMVAVSGTNKEKKRKGIILSIAMIVIYFILMIGLSFLEYKPSIAVVKIDFAVAYIFTKLISMILGIFLIALSGIWAIAYIISLISLTIGSLVALIKKKEDDGKPLSAFLVNLIGLIIIIIIPFIFIV